MRTKISRQAAEHDAKVHTAARAQGLCFSGY
jgi:hypothetical protein